MQRAVMKLLFYLHVTLSMHFKCDIKTCTLLDTFHNTINNDTNVIIKEVYRFIVWFCVLCGSLSAWAIFFGFLRWCNFLENCYITSMQWWLVHKFLAIFSVIFPAVTIASLAWGWVHVRFSPSTIFKKIACVALA